MRQGPNNLQHARRTTLLSLTLALGLSGGLIPDSVSAQGWPSDASVISNRISLNVVQQPIQTALRTLFTSAGLNNSIDQDVQGYATINVSDVSFDVALRALLNATNPPLTYDLNGGIYHVSVKRDAPPTGAAPRPPQQAQATQGVHSYRIPIDQYDAGVIAQMAAAGGSLGGVTIVPPNLVGSGSGQGGANSGRGGQGVGQGGVGGQGGRGGSGGRRGGRRGGG